MNQHQESASGQGLKRIGTLPKSFSKEKESEIFKTHRSALKNAKIIKPIRLHWIRRSFDILHLERSMELHFIQKLLMSQLKQNHRNLYKRKLEKP